MQQGLEFLLHRKRTVRTFVLSRMEITLLLSADTQGKIRKREILLIWTGRFWESIKELFIIRLGQRKGLGIALGYPVFVLAIRPETNEVVLGNDQESLTREVKARMLNAMGVADFAEHGKVKQDLCKKSVDNHKGGWCTTRKRQGRMRSPVTLRNRSVQ